MTYRFRYGTIEDFRRNPHLLEPERPLYSPKLWRQIPALIEQLQDSKRIRIGLTEDSSGRVRQLGACGFIEERCLRESLASSGQGSLTLNEALFGMITSRRRMPFLSARQVASGNAEGSLILFTLFSSPNIDFTAEVPTAEDALLLDASLRGYWNFVGGYRLREIWFELATENAARFFGGAGFRCIREQPLASANGVGAVAKLFRASREEAARNPGAHISIFLRAGHPRLGLSGAEQQLAEFALLDHSDEEIGRLLGITEDGVKKRWRRLYRRVDAVEPTLLPSGAGSSVRRKTLLDALSLRMEEIRPYRSEPGH